MDRNTDREKYIEDTYAEGFAPDAAKTPEAGSVAEPTVVPQPSTGRVFISTVARPVKNMAVSGLEQVTAPQPEQPEESDRDDMADLFEVPEPEDHDMQYDDLLDVEDEDVFGGDSNLSDLTSVSREDVMGKKPVRRQVIRRPQLREEPSGMGEMQ